MSPTIVDVAMALSSATRLDILKAIRPNRSFKEVAAEVQVTQATLTYHVTILRAAGLVRVEQTGCKKYLCRTYNVVKIPIC